MNKTIFLICLLMVFIAGSVSAESYKGIKAEDGVVKIPVKEVSDGSAHFYKINAGSKDIKFFVLKSKDGVIRAAFDACDVCYREKKGYRQEGEFMLCIQCGKKFHSNKINVLTGGCNPSPLDRTTDGKFIYISLNSIRSGVKYF